MKTAFAVFVALLVVGSVPAEAQNLPRCNVGADPVDASRQPLASEEVISNPTNKSIRYASGNGRSVACVLEAGVPIVVDKTTGVAKWVYGCGNDILTPWVPKRPLVRPDPVGIVGAAGRDGKDGKDGKDGLPGERGARGSVWPAVGVALAVATIASFLLRGKKKDDSPKPPEVKTDDPKVICTGIGCPSPPGVGPSRIPIGATLNPIGRSIGISGGFRW